MLGIWLTTYKRDKYKNEFVIKSYITHVQKFKPNKSYNGLSELFLLTGLLWKEY